MRFITRRALVRVAVVCAVGIGVLAWANWPTESIAAGTVADRVVVWKSKRQLELYANGRLLKRYAVSLGRNPVGPKLQEGDKRTPEGLYAVELHNPHSSFHLALKVSYPSPADRTAAAKRGFAPGSDIMIHGMTNGLGLIGRFHRRVDWTAGCIAVTNSEIEEIYRAVPDGTPIEIHP
jgi:murein L,D-transpeptidase YafK